MPSASEQAIAWNSSVTAPTGLCQRIDSSKTVAPCTRSGTASMASSLLGGGVGGEGAAGDAFHVSLERGHDRFTVCRVLGGQPLPERCVIIRQPPLEPSEIPSRRNVGAASRNGEEDDRSDGEADPAQVLSPVSQEDCGECAESDRDRGGSDGDAGCVIHGRCPHFSVFCRFGCSARHASIPSSGQSDVRPIFFGFGKSGERLARL